MKKEILELLEKERKRHKKNQDFCYSATMEQRHRGGVDALGNLIKLVSAMDEPKKIRYPGELYALKLHVKGKTPKLIVGEIIRKVDGVINSHWLLLGHSAIVPYGSNSIEVVDPIQLYLRPGEKITKKSVFMVSKIDSEILTLELKRSSKPKK